MADLQGLRDLDRKNTGVVSYHKIPYFYSKLAYDWCMESIFNGVQLRIVKLIITKAPPLLRYDAFIQFYAFFFIKLLVSNVFSLCRKPISDLF